MNNTFLDEQAIFSALDRPCSDKSFIREILARAQTCNGLTHAEVASLMNVSDPQLLNELFITAAQVKELIYGKRLVLFAPLYVSNLCANECLYCAFRASNKTLCRRALSQSQIADETCALLETGHKRILLVAGEEYPRGEGFSYILSAIKTIYATQKNGHNIRRINVNVAPLDVAEFTKLRELQIGTYQIFQETYHRPTYGQVHTSGRKRDFEWRLSALDRAMEAGLGDVGMGVLFGLADWRYEVLAMLQHAKHLQNRFGVGPHTISVPRIEPADGSTMADAPPAQLSDLDFKKCIAILRLAVPYTGIILSTRESSDIRRSALELGVSQISAASRTDPGGYAQSNKAGSSGGQFSLGDHRSLDEVILDIANLGYLPSFCTGCYRLGRTGGDFMDKAKPGDIVTHCDPNGVATFLEYLIDFASPKTKEVGMSLVARTIDNMSGVAKTRAKKLAAQVMAGQRDVYV